MKENPKIKTLAGEFSLIGYFNKGEMCSGKPQSGFAIAVDNDGEFGAWADHDILNYCDLPDKYDPKDYLTIERK